jgi:metal-dependent amidase/aminoacylase/carboxypeptidase family protein
MRGTAISCVLFSLIIGAVCHEQYLPAAKVLLPWLSSVRREFHADPELMYEEHNTSARIRRYLDELDIKYEYACPSSSACPAPS